MADWLVAVMRSSAIRSQPLEGFTCYQPLYRERRMFRGRRVYIPHPLLGRYLLVEMVEDWIRQFHTITGMPGVAGILLKNEKLMVAREREVLALKKSEVRGYIEVRKKARFIRDQRVVIGRGPFVNTLARFKGTRGVLDVVEIELFGAKREIVLPEGSLTV
jgi:transcription antitermination factor NusG